MALQFAFRTRRRLAAVFALSSYLCDQSDVYELLASSPTQHRPPVFMRHGAADTFIRTQWGEATAEQLRRLGVPVDFATIPRLSHQLSNAAVDQLAAWMESKLPPDSIAC